MKGIILAGGSGSRLYPLTLVTSKQLLPVYDKPMIYYPLSVLMLAGIREVLIISSPGDLPNFQRLLGEGKDLGMSLTYLEQEAPGGLPEAFIIGEAFIGGDEVAMILGDNLFYGNGLGKILKEARDRARKKVATIFGYYVPHPEAYGVIEFDSRHQVKSLEEKPRLPKSNYALTGLYFLDKRAVVFARNLKPSERGELEITDLLRAYLMAGDLVVEQLGRGFAWLDAGTMDSLADAGAFVQMIEKRQGIKISAPEEIAYRNGWIDAGKLLALAGRYGSSPYGAHLKKVSRGEVYE